MQMQTDPDFLENADNPPIVDFWAQISIFQRLHQNIIYHGDGVFWPSPHPESRLRFPKGELEQRHEAGA